MKLCEARVGDVIYEEGKSLVKVRSFVPSNADVVSSDWSRRVSGTDTGICDIHGKPSLDSYTRVVEGTGSRAPGWTGYLSTEGTSDILVTCKEYDGNNIVFTDAEGSIYALPTTSEYTTKDLDG